MTWMDVAVSSQVSAIREAAPLTSHQRQAVIAPANARKLNPSDSAVSECQTNETATSAKGMSRLHDHHSGRSQMYAMETSANANASASRPVRSHLIVLR